MKTKDNVEDKAHSVDMKDLADSVNNVAKTTGAAVKGSVKTVGALAKTISFIFNNLPLVGIIIAVLVATWLFLFNPFGWNINLFGKPQIENTANIVEEVKKISELTTACYYEESVIQNSKLTTKKHWFGNESDTINNTVVLTVLCKVRAGYDLSMLGENDLVIKGDTVNVKLPAPKIFDVISNPSDYRIFEETGEWQHEEIVAMQVAGKEKMLQNALDDNILEKANAFGKERVTSLFSTFGFNVVNVTLTDVPVRKMEPAVME